jgi:hypothetical protein
VASFVKHSNQGQGLSSFGNRTGRHCSKHSVKNSIYDINEGNSLLSNEDTFFDQHNLSSVIQTHKQGPGKLTQLVQQEYQAKKAYRDTLVELKKTLGKSYRKEETTLFGG